MWHNIKRDAIQWSKECLPCQQSKVDKHVKTPLKSFLTPSHRFTNIHVDIVGPLPISKENKYLFTIIDRYTRWPEAIRMKDQTAEDCTRALMIWISRFGIPLEITSDRGRQFLSILWKELASLLSIKINNTTSFHPQCNGLVERFHRQLKASLKAKLKNNNWVDLLPLVLLGLRTAPKEDLNCSSAELVYGTTLRLPGEFFDQQTKYIDQSDYIKELRETFKLILPTQTSCHGNKPGKSLAILLTTCDFIFIRNYAHRSPFQKVYVGPYRVIERKVKYFVVEKNGKKDSISVDRLKPAYVTKDTPLPFVRRGRTSGARRLWGGVL